MLTIAPLAALRCDGRAHPPHAGARKSEHGGQVRFQEAGELGIVGFLRPVRAADAGIVHQHAQRPERRLGLGDHFLGGAGQRHVREQRAERGFLRAGERGGFLQSFLADVHRQHRRPIAREPQRRCPADAAGRPGHHRRAAPETGAHAPVSPAREALKFRAREALKFRRIFRLVCMSASCPATVSWRPPVLNRLCGKEAGSRQAGPGGRPEQGLAFIGMAGQFYRYYRLFSKQADEHRRGEEL